MVRDHPGEIEVLRFTDDANTRDVTKLQQEIARTFAGSGAGREFMLWIDEQRAIGERMIAKDSSPTRCIGYATFADTYEPESWPWLERLRRDITPEMAPTSFRLERLQNLLADLAEALDTKGVRYTYPLRRVKRRSSAHP